MYGGKRLGVNWVQGKHTAVSFKSNAKKEQKTKTCKNKNCPNVSNVFSASFIGGVHKESCLMGLWSARPSDNASRASAWPVQLRPTGAFDKGPGEITR